MSDIDIDKLTDAQLDRLQQRLSDRAITRRNEMARAEAERRNPGPIMARAGYGNAGISFGNALARRNWDQECVDALSRQKVRFAVAPMTSVVGRDGKRIKAGEEVRPELLDARQGPPLAQIQRLIADGYVLENRGVP